MVGGKQGLRGKGGHWNRGRTTLHPCSPFPQNSVMHPFSKFCLCPQTPTSYQLLKTHQALSRLRALAPPLDSSPLGSLLHIFTCHLLLAPQSSLASAVSLQLLLQLWGLLCSSSAVSFQYLPEHLCLCLPVFIPPWSLSEGLTIFCPLFRLRHPLPVSLHLSLSLFKLHFSLCLPTSVSLSFCLSQVFLSPQLRLTLSISLSGKLCISPICLHLHSISTVSQRSTQEYSRFFCVSPYQSPSLPVPPSLSRPSLWAPPYLPPSPLPATAVGVTLQPAGLREQLTTHFLASGWAPAATKLCQPGPRRLWPTRTSTASPQSRAHNFLKDSTGLGDGRGQPPPHSPKSRAQTRCSAVARCAPCRAPPAHSPSAAPTTKASSVSMTALRTLRPPPGPPVL